MLLIYLTLIIMAENLVFQVDLSINPEIKGTKDAN